MLTKEDNEMIIHVGPGTPMGNLLRRYWTPALLSEELPSPDCTPVRVRLLCEDLVAFRDSEGRVGLIDINCPHRGTSLFFGRNEDGGLRCVYHGWQFDVNGQCIDMPSEPGSNFKDKLRVLSYPTHESGGIVWTYMGPLDKMTGFRDFGTEALPREKWRASKRIQPMSWMQVMEGGLDTTHPSWLHMWAGAQDLDDDGSDAPGIYNSGRAQWRFWAHDRAPVVEVVEAWHGFRAVGLRNTPNGNTHARLYQYTIPYTSGPGGGGWTVPIDDEQTNSFNFATIHTEMKDQLVVGDASSGTGTMGGIGRVGSVVRQRGLAIPEWPYDEDGTPRNKANDWLIDREAQKDGTIFTGIRGSFNNQDIMATQTAFTDRTKEHLGSLDRKIILMRRSLLNAAKNLARGIEPPAIDPSLPYDRIGTPDKVLEPGEDWTILGSENDPNLNQLREAAPAVAVPPPLA